MTICSQCNGPQADAEAFECEACTAATLEACAVFERTTLPEPAPTAPAPPVVIPPDDVPPGERLEVDVDLEF